jgi:PAS domain S-box-containing protein
MADADGLRQRISELERELQSLRAFEEAPYRAVVEDMSELVVRWKVDGTRLFVNDAYCRLFGKSRSELVGTSFWPLVREEDRERVEKRILALTPEAPVSSGRHRSTGANGETIWMEWVDRALFDAQRNVTEMQSVGRDITERVRLEEQARRVENADAVARVSARIAHDMNNLLTVLMSEVRELERRTGPSEELRTMDEALVRIVDLVAALGSLRASAVLVPERVDVNECVESLVNLLAEVSGERVTLKCELSGGPCVIEGDPTQLDQVLLNLVRNAAEAMPNGGEIRISTRVAMFTDTNGGTFSRVFLEVADTGTGISAELLPRVFDPNITTKASGKGLGLATVKTIVEAHGGRVRVESSPGGTRFEIELPPAPS